MYIENIARIRNETLTLSSILFNSLNASRYLLRILSGGDVLASFLEYLKVFLAGVEPI